MYMFVFFFFFVGMHLGTDNYKPRPHTTPDRSKCCGATGHGLGLFRRRQICKQMASSKT